MKYAAIYFHEDYGKEALDLQLRIRSDTGQEQAEPIVASITEGRMVRGTNDVAAVDAVLIDAALSDTLRKRILELHDRHNRPYEVHHIKVGVTSGVFEFVKESKDGDPSPSDNAAAVR